MKTFIILAVIISNGFLQLSAQQKSILDILQKKPEPVSKPNHKPPTIKSSCCYSNPYTLTPCAQSLFQSYKNLTSGAGVRICNTTVNYPSVSFAMPENCYSLQITSTSMVTYTSFYVPTANIFRTIWGSIPGNFTFYGVCPPDPIIFPHPGSLVENHVFASKLIKQSDYKAFTGIKSYSSMGAVPAIMPSEIAQIVTVYIEENGGYISNTEADAYNNKLSSKGIVAIVKLKSGAYEQCYVINNYDGNGTIYWKENNSACVR